MKVRSPSPSADAGDLAGRWCLITGASTGIGRETALALAARGASLWMVSRDRARGEAAREEVRDRAQGGDVRLLLADLSTQAGVHLAAQEVLDSGLPLHVLVNNAGAVFLERGETEDGIETTLALNHLAPFLLTMLLLERLLQSAPARVITVSSAGHSRGRIVLADLEASQGYQGFLQYCNTKLANVLFTYELARRYEGRGLVAHAVHPGAVRTGLGMNNRGWVRMLWKLAHPFFRDAARGAETCVFLASAPEVADVTGKYWIDCRDQRSSPHSYDEAMAAALWQASRQLTGLSRQGTAGEDA